MRTQRKEVGQLEMQPGQLRFDYVSAQVLPPAAPGPALADNYLYITDDT